MRSVSNHGGAFTLADKTQKNTRNKCAGTFLQLVTNWWITLIENRHNNEPTENTCCSGVK